MQPKHANGRSYSVDYEVTMPAHLALEVVNGNGPVQGEDVRSAVAVETGNGDVELSGLYGPLEVTVGNGSVVGSTFLPPGEHLVARVGNGGLRMTVQSQVSAELKAHVGNGPLTVTGLQLTDQITSPGLVTGILGGGEGLIELTVGNGWLHVSGT